jgi:hypothetical protein
VQGRCTPARVRQLAIDLVGVSASLLASALSDGRAHCAAQCRALLVGPRCKHDRHFAGSVEADYDL